MKHQKIEIEGNIYHVKVVETEDEFDNGLMGVEHLAPNEGMLFPFKEYETQSFWMKDTLIPLDIIFINRDNIVTKIVQGVPLSEEPIMGDALYILELNANSDVELDDEVDFEIDDSEEKDDKMYVISMEGKPIMELEGGERIFSRKNTKNLIKFAKKAYNSEKDSDYKALGKRLFKYLDIQDNNEPQYVEE